MFVRKVADRQWHPLLSVTVPMGLGGARADRRLNLACVRTIPRGLKSCAVEQVTSGTLGI